MALPVVWAVVWAVAWAVVWALAHNPMLSGWAAVWALGGRHLRRHKWWIDSPHQSAFAHVAALPSSNAVTPIA